ncbi:MAG: hypothetical protein MUE80_05495 [Acidobacteria bacterium]|nr:hypothetical protein [Acidobacteriota bacterium]
MSRTPLRSPMAVTLALAALAAAVAVAAAQDVAPVPQHLTGTVSIEVPVRVFKGGAFVDGIPLGDFEVYENGKLQALDAVYLVKKAFVERREETKAYRPDTGRHFYLFFEMTEFDPRVREALSFFVREVLADGDELVIVTPLKTYRMKSDVLRAAGRDEVFEKLIGILRRDILIGNTEYREILDEMTGLAATISSSIGVNTSGASTQAMGDSFGFSDSVFELKTSMEEQLQLYAATLSRLENVRSLDQTRVDRLAEYLREQTGQKEVFLFYQREFIPKIDPSALTVLMSTYNQRPDVIQTVHTVFEFFRREEPVDIEPVKRAYADAGASVHFLYLTRPAPRVRGVVMEEQSEDIFAPFREMSRATGGFMASTANVEAAMKSAVAAAENYYLLYYTPRDYTADGLFRQITVKVKGGDYRVSHRQGYVAD